jgi:exopolysaccharide biosynthesis polyprenyl glycosylphosphotransferase
VPPRARRLRRASRAAHQDVAVAAHDGAGKVEVSVGVSTAETSLQGTRGSRGNRGNRANGKVHSSGGSNHTSGGSGQATGGGHASDGDDHAAGSGHASGGDHATGSSPVSGNGATAGNGTKAGSGRPVRLDSLDNLTEGIVVRRMLPRPASQQANAKLHRGIVYARVLLDLLAITFSLMVATAIRFGPEAIASAGTPEPYGKWLPLWIPLWWGGLIAAGTYDRLRTENPAEELRRVIHGVTLGALMAVVSSFSTGFHLSRSWLFISVGTALVTVTTGRFVMRRILHGLRRRGLMRRRALVVGADRSGKAVARSVGKAPWEGIDVLGYIAVNGQVGDGLSNDDVVLGTVDRLKDLARGLQISEVLVAPTVAGNGHLSEVVAALDGIPVDLRIATGLEGFLTSRLTFQPLGDSPLVSVERNELRPSGRIIKRMLDLVLAGGLLVVTAPVMAAAAIAIKLDSKGPVFFRQRRVGIGGREFNIWKLRSMVADAEELKKLLAAQNEADGLLFKMIDDPRITRVGRIIRKTCIDELPQLFNVLAGHMSLVGPRPPLPEEVALYDKRIGRRLLVRPGLTGLWQINGRHELTFEDYIRFDLMYVQNWSLALDLYILGKTLPAVVAGRGAS